VHGVLKKHQIRKEKILLLSIGELDLGFPDHHHPKKDISDDPDEIVPLDETVCFDI